MLVKSNAKTTLTLFLASLAVVVGNANAAAADVTSVTTAITDAATPIAAIGAAVLVLMVGIKTYKWIRRAL